MKREVLPGGYCTDTYAAYVCTESLLSPFSAVQVQDENEGICRDSFNY